MFKATRENILKSQRGSILASFTIILTILTSVLLYTASTSLANKVGIERTINNALAMGIAEGGVEKAVWVLKQGSYTGETAKWKDQFLRTIGTWYLWATFFPFIHRLAGEFRFARRTRVKSALVHVLAGAAAAILHATIQVLFNDWLLNPQRNWNAIRNILEDYFSSTLLWRFFVYQAILAVCIALDSYRRARETEIQASEIEAGIQRLAEAVSEVLIANGG